MNDFIERIRNAFRRTADRVTGQHVPIQMSHAPVEELESRRLRTPPVDIYENDREIMIIADTPGHIQYTRNMVTGASTANLAVILVDARETIVAANPEHSEYARYAVRAEEVAR